MTTDLIAASACDLVDQLRAGAVSPLELLDAVAARIDAVDGAVNALPTLCFERARDHARRLEALSPAERGELAGLPIAVKDLVDVAGVRSTHGSPIYADAIPAASDRAVARLEAAGGIVYGKSNTPEFGAGANTFNEVFGATRNPWDLRMSAAGSSGGSAAALASGTAWLATGSDLGGSLRNPASFCGVVGLRPAPGRVACNPGADPFATLAVDGPMARDVDDVALFLDAMSGADPSLPLALNAPTESFRTTAARRTRPRRVAFSADLAITPVDPEVAEICASAARRFETMGVVVEEAHPDLSDAHEAFQILRAHGFALGYEALLATHRDQLKPEVIWNIEKGLALSSDDVRRAQRLRGEMTMRAVAFFERYDLLLTPATIVPPYPVEERYPTSCAGVAFESYIDWLAIAYAITLTSLPALSLPCGFTRAGLPVGLQIVAPLRGEATLLSAAGALQDALQVPKTPIQPRDVAQPRP